jgi:putative restriction endonuclease
MTVAERAFQIWPLLVLSATKHQILFYDELGKIIGVPNPALGQLLEPIQSYCVINNLPALTSIVVSSKTGLPGGGFTAASDVPAEQAKVFMFDWLCIHPVIKDFESA